MTDDLRMALVSLGVALMGVGSLLLAVSMLARERESIARMRIAYAGVVFGVAAATCGGAYGLVRLSLVPGFEQATSIGVRFSVGAFIAALVVLFLLMVAMMVRLVWPDRPRTER